MPDAAQKAGSRKSRSWKQDPEAVRADILNVAREEFAEHGLSGARVQEIAARTQTSKRMIFYYFGDKESLYQAVLERAYQEVRDGEAALDLGDLPPDQALARLVDYTFEHHRAQPEFIRLVMIENIHKGKHLAQSETIEKTNTPAITQLEEICARGIASGAFRPDMKALHLHWQISALSFFNVSNMPTFSLIFGDELNTNEGQKTLKKFVVDSILRLALKSPTN
ncbi:MAG: TetR/AcrR family transcriptional regulator [Ruegeria sp.]|nr:TetR/AcrR family transcriptional regulator [Ruegeria sp.]